MKQVSTRPAGRPREFDREAALDLALRVFWEYGYEAASLAMLCERMGLTPPQVYNAYGDKETLFRLAVKRYVATESDFVDRALDSRGTAREAICCLVAGAAIAYTRPGYPRGCLTVTGAIVASPAAVAVVEALEGYRKAAEERIATRLEQDDADLPANTDTKVLARYFAGVLLGMSIQARDGKSAEELKGQADIALRAWPVKTAD